LPQVPGLIAQIPEHFMSDFFRAQLYLDLHLWDSAASVLDGPLLQQFPDSPFTLSQRAFCLYSRQRMRRPTRPCMPLRHRVNNREGRRRALVGF